MHHRHAIPVWREHMAGLGGIRVFERWDMWGMRNEKKEYQQRAYRDLKKENEAISLLICTLLKIILPVH